MAFPGSVEKKKEPASGQKQAFILQFIQLDGGAVLTDVFVVPVCAVVPPFVLASQAR